MRVWIVTIGLLSAPLATWAAPVGRVVLGEEPTQVNRGQDQLRPVPGLVLQEGDVLKSLGRASLKAFVGGVLVIAGPLAEVRIASMNPLVFELVKGGARIVTEPGKPRAFIVRTPKAQIDIAQGDIFARYNVSSEFTELVVIAGSARAANLGDVTGAVEVRERESTVLIPESAPSQPGRLSEAEIRDLTRDLESAVAPLPKGDIYEAMGPTIERMSGAFAEIRRRLARPSLPENAPFRTFDTRRVLPTAEAVERGAMLSAPADAGVNVKWEFERAPRLKEK